MSARRAEIELRAKSIDSENFFQMLGLSTTATAEDIQGAYFALARKWHPDRQPSDLADVKPHVARVFGRLSEAYHTLSDTRRRSEYQHLVAAGGGSPDEKDKIARVVDAALEFQKAEVLLRKHDFVGAEVLARRAVEADPEQPEYRTLLVWVQAQRRGEAANAAGGNTTSVYDDLIKQLDEVLKDEPHYERALYYRGMLLKRAGKLDKAMRDLRLAAEINPKNIDAIREVRLFNMRNRGRTAPPPSGSKRPGTQRPGPPSKDPSGGGLFGKFFKK